MDILCESIPCRENMNRNSKKGIRTIWLIGLPAVTTMQKSIREMNFYNWVKPISHLNKIRVLVLSSARKLFRTKIFNWVRWNYHWIVNISGNCRFLLISLQINLSVLLNIPLLSFRKLDQIWELQITLTLTHLPLQPISGVFSLSLSMIWEELAQSSQSCVG